MSARLASGVPVKWCWLHEAVSSSKIGEKEPSTASSSLNLTFISFFLSSNYALGVEFVSVAPFFSFFTVHLSPLKLSSILEKTRRPCLCCGGTQEGIVSYAWEFSGSCKYLWDVRSGRWREKWEMVCSCHCSSHDLWRHCHRRPLLPCQELLCLQVTWAKVMTLSGVTKSDHWQYKNA